jgi:prepilin-type N-terminal cleavage/methylation domain-containing protein
MKLSFFRRRRGVAFTLVELLVVIGIIAILAGVIIGGVSSAIRFAKRTKANTEASQIQTAVQGYYTEYGVYPVPTGAATGDAYYNGTDVGDWENLTWALCGNINPSTGTTVTSTVPNVRNISFLSPTHSDLDTMGDGIVVNPFGSSADANATYYFIAIDTDYSGVVGDSGAAKGNMPDFTQTNSLTMLANGTPGGVAVWSPCDQALSGAKYHPSFWAHTY